VARTELTPEGAQRIVARVRAAKRPGDTAVVSIHWGSNWGFGVPIEQRRFAHALIDGGVDVVHGHSSHHLKGAELYRGRLVIYGCGDLISDYEGIKVGPGGPGGSLTLRSSGASCANALHGWACR
jgi:poly-gamma-glutamate synthesis protein (capsule biosynthesis protein)